MESFDAIGCLPSLDLAFGMEVYGIHSMNILPENSDWQLILVPMWLVFYLESDFPTMLLILLVEELLLFGE